MSLRLDGTNALSYLGVTAQNPPPLFIQTARPTSKNFGNLGTLWLIPSADAPPSGELWILVSIANNTAVWTEITGGGGGVVPGNQFTLLTADGSGGYGPNVGPGTAGQVLLSGGGAGNPDFVSATAGTGLTVTANAATFEYRFDIPDYNLIVGDSAFDIVEIPPSATVGVPFVSKGAGTYPAYDTALVVGGGTGITTTTAYAPICGGTTATGAFQAADSGISNVGYVLTSTGAASLPTWQAAGGGSGTDDFVTDAGTATQVGSSINMLGGHDINTAGAGDTVTINLDNAITLGDLTPIGAGSDAITLTTGDVTFTTGSIKFPTTTATAGVIFSNGNRFVHAYGTDNTFVGKNSGNFTLTGIDLVGLGSGSLNAATTATGAVALGLDAMNAITTGGLFSVAIGHSALGSATTAANTSIAIGGGTLSGAYTGSDCVAIGNNVLQDSTSGNNKIAIGSNAMDAITTGGVNSIAIGTDALGAATTGAPDTIAIGSNAIDAVTTDVSPRIGIGTDALGVATSGGDNAIAIGYHAMDAATTGGSNSIAIGTDALGAVTTGGDDTVAIGYQAGSAYTTESSNLVISNVGQAADSGVIRIGTDGTHLNTYIAGIEDVNVGNVAKVVTIDGDQLGSATITAGSNVTIGTSANTITINSIGGSSGSGNMSVNVQVFTSNGTYTPTAGMTYCMVQLVGGGGAGSYAPAIPTPQLIGVIGKGGAGGGYCQKIFDAATIGASQSVTIGTGGVATTSTAPAGGNSAFGALLTANGGGGSSGTTGNFVTTAPNPGGSATGGDINIPGEAGGYGFKGATVFLSGKGGSSVLGMGGNQLATFNSLGSAGNSGTGYGAGGGSALSVFTGTPGTRPALAGGSGSNGICIVTEYINSNVVLKLSVTLTSTEIKFLDAIPITIIPTPGAGKFIMVQSVNCVLNYGGSNPFTGGADIELRYDDGTGKTINSSIITNTVMNSSSNQYYLSGTGSSISGSLSEIENLKVVATNSGAAYGGNAADNNTLTITVEYVVIDI